MKKKITISVIGGHDATPSQEQLAYEAGKIVAQAGAVLVCGGLTGMMTAASKGAKEAGGLTIGILPGKDKGDANPYIDIPLPTSIGFARNVFVACSADIIIALPGSHGTRSEISYGLVFKRPVIDLGGWDIPGMIAAKDLKQAGSITNDLIKKIQSA